MVEASFLGILLSFLTNIYYTIVSLFNNLIQFLDFGFVIGDTTVTVGAVLFGGGFIIYLTYKVLSPFE